MSEPHPVVGAAAIAVELVAHPRVGERWSEPSVLAGYRVGGLAAHLVRAIETARTYAEAEPPAGDATPVGAAGYYATVLGDHDPLDSELHRAVRSRGEQRVEAGHVALVADASSALAWLSAAELDLDAPISVFDGVVVRLDDYLDSRLVELLVHSDDLAASIAVATPRFADVAADTVARMLTELVLRRQPPARIALALARPERHPMPGAFDTSATT